MSSFSALSARFFNRRRLSSPTPARPQKDSRRADRYPGAPQNCKRQVSNGVEIERRELPSPRGERVAEDEIEQGRRAEPYRQHAHHAPGIRPGNEAPARAVPHDPDPETE